MAPCKFFVQGRCTYGTACKNSHEALTTPGTWRSTSTNLIVQSTLASAENKKGPSESGSTQATNTCWFYSQGKCTYGAACRLSHEVALPNIHRLSMRTSGAEALNARLLEKEHGDISSTIFVPSPVQHNSNDRPPPKLKADVPSFTPGAPPTKATTQPSLIRGRDASPVCIFFSKGFCRNGETCHFRHEAPTTFSSPSKQVEQNIPDFSNDTAHLSIATSLTQEFHDASVTFKGGAEVSNIKLFSDFSTIQILGLSPDVRASSVTCLLSGLGFQVPESSILVKSLGEEGSVAEVKLEDPTFARAVTRKFDSRGEDNIKSNISIKPLAGTAAAGTLANRLQLNTVTCTWYKPSRIAWLMYRSHANAEEAKHALQSRKILQRTPTYSMEPGGGRLAITLAVGNLDISTQKRDIYAVLPSSLHPERINFGDPTYQLSDTKASEKVEALLRRKGGLESFQWQILPGNSKIKATATFTDRDDAAEAVRSLNNNPVGGLGKLLVAHVVSVKYNVPNAIMAAISGDINQLREKNWQNGYVHLKTYPSAEKPVTAIRVFGENIKHVAEAKGEIERMLAGHVVMDGDSSLWDPYFMNAMSLGYLNDLSRHHQLYVYRDARKCRLLIYGGSSASRLDVERVLGAKVKALRQITHIIVLNADLLKSAMQGGMRRLKEKFGTAVTLNVSANPKTISLVGSVEEFQEAKELLQEDNGETKDGDDCVVCWTEATEPLHTTCGHIYCKECFANQAASSDDIPVRCYGNEGKCLQVFSIGRLKTMLSHTAFEELLQSSFDTYIRTHPKDFHHCPTPDCPQVYRITVASKSFLCSTCLTSICTACNMIAHDGMTCEEFKDLKSGGDKAFQKWKEENDVRDCPNCKSPIEKSHGCNHMECQHCSTHICWFCMKHFGTSVDCYAHMSKVHRNYYEE